MPVFIRKSFNKPALHVLLIALLGLMAYSNTFDVPFQFDDRANIVENLYIKDVSNFLRDQAKELVPFWVYDNIRTRPLGYFTFALNYGAHGFDIWGYHVVNLVIHVTTALLVYALVILTFKTPFMAGSTLSRKAPFVALSVALLFVSHPIQTQAVTYIYQRFASLATMLYLLSLVLYVKYRLAPSSRVKTILLYITSLFATLLAIKTKETAITLPAAVALYEFLFFKGKTIRRFMYLLPFFLMVPVIPMARVDFDGSYGDLIGDIGEAARKESAMPRLEYLSTEFRVMVTYLRLLVLPVGQNLDYDYPIYHSFFEPPVLLSFLFLLSIFALGMYCLVRSSKFGVRIGQGPHSSLVTRHSSLPLRLFAFGIFWFFLTLSVESSVLPIADVIYEHRVYLPSVGFFIAVVTAAFLLLEMQENQKMKNAAAGVFVLVLVALLSATFARNAVWQSKASLWADVVKKSPENARAHNNLGNAYTSEGMVDKAIEQYLSALKARPRVMPTPHYYAEIHYNLANAYKDAGFPDNAIEHYRKSLRIDFKNLDAFNNLGIVYSSKGMAQKAITYFQAAVELDPGYAEAHFNLGEAYSSRGWPDKAIEHYGAFLRLRPDHKEAHYNIALAYEEKGLAEKAEEHFRRAEELNIED